MMAGSGCHEIRDRDVNMAHRSLQPGVSPQTERNTPTKTSLSPDLLTSVTLLDRWLSVE
jgi:hypothetical protein